MLIRIVTLQGEDRISGRRLPDGSLPVGSRCNRCHGTPAESLQMLRLHVATPYGDVNTTEALKQCHPRSLAHLLGQCRALFYLWLVDTALQRFLHTVFLSKFLQGHTELILAVALIPHIEIKGREIAATVTHAVIFYMPTVTTIFWWV